MEGLGILEFSGQHPEWNGRNGRNEDLNGNGRRLMSSISGFTVSTIFGRVTSLLRLHQNLNSQVFCNQNVEFFLDFIARIKLQRTPEYIVCAVICTITERRITISIGASNKGNSGGSMLPIFTIKPHIKALAAICNLLQSKHILL